MAERGMRHFPEDIVERTAIATGSDKKANKNTIIKISALKNITNDHKLIVRNCIYDYFYLTERVVPSVKQLYEKLKEDNQFPGTIKNLKRILKDLGFTKLRIHRNLNVLIEKSKFQLQRIQFSEAIAKFRSEGRTIVYTGESAIGNVLLNITSSESGSRKNKGQRIILGHAMSSDGYIPNSQILFQETTRRAYNITYHRWMRIQVVPNIPPKSVVVINNALCNNILEDYVITIYSNRSDMEAWLRERNIPFSEHMFKPELYKLVSFHKDHKIQYKINTIIEEAGHQVLRIPEIYLDLNPMTKIFEDISNFVKENEDNILNYADFKQLITEKYGNISTIECKISLERVKKVEAKYDKLDRLVDDLTDELADQVVEDESRGPYADMMYSDLDDSDDQMDIGIKEDVEIKYEPDDNDPLQKN